MQKARSHRTSLLLPLVGRRVQGLLHSSIRGSFHLSLTVLVRYRSLGSIQPYGMGPANSHRISRVPRYSGYCQVHSLFRIQDFHLLWSNFPVCSSITNESTLQSYNPNNAETVLVWAGPRSLATTKGITFVFSSYGYLDVSVPHVRSPLCGVTCLLHAGLPHSEICGSISYVPIPAAYRSLSRPSSPPRAQASTVCPYLFCRLSVLKLPVRVQMVVYLLLFFALRCFLVFLLIMSMIA